MKTKKLSFKKQLSAPGLLKITRQAFQKIPDYLKSTSPFSLADCLTSGLALFGLKYPSLLQFDKDSRSDDMAKNNLRTLYGIKQVPCDTTMRERLDKVEPYFLQKPINKIIATLQRGKILEQYRYFQNYLLVAIDGSGYFSSHQIHCSSCCEKHHQDGSVTYYHQMLAAVIVHPLHKIVFPLAVEPIQKDDGISKNDCEHNAAKRLLVTIHNSHPHLNVIFLLDALYADGPIIRLLKQYGFRFIITAKAKDLKYLFEIYTFRQKEECLLQGAQGQEERYLFANDLPLNSVHDEIQVNCLEFFETGAKEHHFCWITDLLLNKTNFDIIARGGRARWHIENETFNTLKNQGYQFEHNFGHGYKHLGTVMAYLMFTAFLIDQVQEFCCKYFKAALIKCESRKYLWRKMSGLFVHYFLDSWEYLFLAIINGFRSKIEIFDSS